MRPIGPRVRAWRGSAESSHSGESDLIPHRPASLASLTQNFCTLLRTVSILERERLGTVYRPLTGISRLLGSGWQGRTRCAIARRPGKPLRRPSGGRVAGEERWSLRRLESSGTSPKWSFPFISHDAGDGQPQAKRRIADLANAVL